jgi:effector-binding domain-containing protein
LFTIGEFSMITHLSVKTLRYYHDEGILKPDYVDADTGYRYYREASVDKAALISMLRSIDFSINEIKEILKSCTDDIDITVFFEQQQDKIRAKIDKYVRMESIIKEMLKTIRENNMKYKDNYTVEIKDIDDIIFAGNRFKGEYKNVGNSFKLAGRAAGRFIAGKAMSLYYDREYREKDADIEAGFPVSKTISSENINCRVLKGGKFVTLIHRGPYGNLSRSYEKIFGFINGNKLNAGSPSREVYLKGPGILFRGNQDKYLTEIQIPVE